MTRIVLHTVMEEKRGGTPSWRNMKHVADRLAAYGEAVEAFFEAKEVWPDLFHDFEVLYLPSAPAMTFTLNQSSGTRRSHALVGKLAKNADELKRLRTYTRELQEKYKIDKQISKDWPTQEDVFFVHAEIRLHRWLETSEGGTHVGRFFEGYKYIGSSKPTCRLCHYYFELHGTDVQVRDSHRNLYPRWRMHDVFPEDGLSVNGEDPEQERMLLVHKIKDRVVSDIKQILNNKLADRRENDSTDKHTADMLAHGSTYLDEATFAFGRLGVTSELDNSQDDTSPGSSHKLPQDAGSHGGQKQAVGERGIAEPSFTVPPINTESPIILFRGRQGMANRGRGATTRGRGRPAPRG